MSIEKQTVNIDMDGVLAGFDLRVDQIAKDTYGLEKPTFRRHFHSALNYPSKYHDALDAAMIERGFFSSLPLLEGAVYGIQRIIDAGYHPRILSSPISRNPYSKKEKIGWLEEYIEPSVGSFIVAQAIITENKHLHDGELLIDDRPEIKHSEDATWEHVLFTQDYNSHIIGKPRISDWHDPNLEDVLRVASTRPKESRRTEPAIIEPK